MKRAERIERFVQECCDDLDLDYDYFFDGLTADPDAGDLSWHGKKTAVNLQAVEYASEVLGMSVEDILHTNDKSIHQWYDRFPYLLYTGAFREAYRRTNYGDQYDNMRLLEVIFGADLDTHCPRRYNANDVQRRLVAQIEEMKAVMPIEIHKEGKLTHLTIETKNFCHFPEIKEMTESFLDMVQTAKTLFIKAVNGALSDNEIHEYNLLVSVLGIRDISAPSMFLYYRNALNCRKLYANVTEEDFFQHIRLNTACLNLDAYNTFEPWRCTEFVNDEDLVKRYAQQIPNAKARMRKYSMEVRHFSCFYSWIDEKAFEESDTEEDDDSGSAWMHDYDYDDDDYDEPFEVYVDKTDEELDGDGETADRLSGYCKSVKLGGIDVPSVNDRPIDPNLSIQRIEELIVHCKRTCYVDRLNQHIHTERSGDAYE